MVDQDQEIQNRFPIRELSARTQVNTVTLRAWERRYGLLKPERTVKGHRLYSQEDVSTVERIIALVARGVPLRKVKPLLQGSDELSTVDENDTEIWSSSVADLIASIELFSVTKLEHLINDVFANYPAAICRERLIDPVFSILSTRDKNGATYTFMENEFLRYVLQRLSGKISQKKRSVDLVLIIGPQTPIWRLALMAIELQDAKFSVYLIHREFSVESLIDFVTKSKDVDVVFYQDGIWKDKEKTRVVGALGENERLFMCGTAPVLSQLNIEGRVFSDLNSFIVNFLQQHEV